MPFRVTLRSSTAGHNYFMLSSFLVIFFSASFSFLVRFWVFYPLFGLFWILNYMCDECAVDSLSTSPYGVGASHLWLWVCAIFLWRELKSLLVPLCPNFSPLSASSLPFPGQSASHYWCSIRQCPSTEQTHTEITLQTLRLPVCFHFDYSSPV